MKVAFLVDYYQPFTPGGTEWSVFYLAKQLQQKDVESIIFTPNYGAANEEIIDGIKVIRFPIFKKPKNSRSVINPVWQNNPLFFLWSSFFILKYCRGFDVIHVNGKFLIPGAWLAAKLLSLPLIVTIRDKQLLCNYGLCFFEDNRYKACNFFEYLIKDLPWYYQNYTNQKNISSATFVLLSGVYTRFSHRIIKFFAMRADQVLAISKSQKKYMEVNGFANVNVIYNSAPFPELKKVANRKGILYAGKLSLGKGLFILFNAIPEVEKYFDQKFIFAGGIEDKQQLEKLVIKLNIKKYVVFLGGVDHHKLQKLYQSCKLAVMPSVFPEAFGRIALESLAAGTPAVVLDKGGLPEIIESGVTGEISQADSLDLANKIKKVLKGNEKYVKNILAQRQKLIKKFQIEPIEQHLKLYRKLSR